MQKIATLIYKSIRIIMIQLRLIINHTITYCMLYCNDVSFKKLRTNGIPYISIARGGNCIIQDNFRMNNGLLGNPIGRPQRCTLFVDRGATLIIGNEVSISSTAIVVHEKITIGDHVKIGGGVCIYDTDFHSLDSKHRENPKMDRQFENKLPVSIEDHVFIGAHTTILKGVTIGKNSIVGACSVVTKSIPPNEIWAGNPARLIKTIAPDD